MDYIRIGQQTTDNGQQALSISVEEIKNLLKDWIKLYPNSFAPDVEFKIYQLADGDVIVELHEDLSSMAVSLLVLYFETTVNSQQLIAYITIDDTEVLLKQNIGKRAMVFCELGIRNEELGIETRETTSIKKAQNSQLTAHSSVRFLLDDNYVLDYNFEKRPQPVKDSCLRFEEPELTLPEEYESVVVGDVVEKDKTAETMCTSSILDEGLTPKKMLAYLLCGAIGLGIGFLIVYFMGK